MNELGKIFNRLLSPLFSISRRESSALAFSLSGLFMIIPSFVLPFVSLGKFGQTHVCFIINSAEGFWQHGMSLLGAWVFFCGMLAPVITLVLLAVLFSHVISKDAKRYNGLSQAAWQIGRWAMPAVLGLGVLVSFFKIRDLVNVEIGPGFWCFMGACIMLMLSWRIFLLEIYGKEPK